MKEIFVEIIVFSDKVVVRRSGKRRYLRLNEKPILRFGLDKADTLTLGNCLIKIVNDPISSDFQDKVFEINNIDI